jgi:hypothetical protein
MPAHEYSKELQVETRAESSEIPIYLQALAAGENILKIPFPGEASRS